MDLELKQKQFNTAMALYENTIPYRLTGKAVSVINISLQALSVYLLYMHPVSPSGFAIALVLGYVLADFINGLAHLLMDTNDRYESIAGPLIAAFHLHHRTPRYKKNNLAIVYFNETGSKIWLAFYLSFTVLLLQWISINHIFAHTLVYIGILSSVAELSHYLCHTSAARSVRFLALTGVILSKHRHARHHREDNVQYAFLNGISDFVIDRIAKKWFTGYKNTTDLHYARYRGMDTDNRILNTTVHLQ